MVEAVQLWETCRRTFITGRRTFNRHYCQGLDELRLGSPSARTPLAVDEEEQGMGFESLPVLHHPGEAVVCREREREVGGVGQTRRLVCRPGDATGMGH